MSDWEIESGGQPQGPFSETSLVASIERGLPATTRARRVGEQDWLPIGAHPPFAEALARAARPTGYVAPVVQPPIVMVHKTEGGSHSAMTCGLILAFPVLAVVVMLLARACAAIIGP